jgi:hypothetical protein
MTTPRIARFSNDLYDASVLDEFQLWKTKDGRLLYLKEMDDAHLLNTIRLLERTYETYFLLVCDEKTKQYMPPDVRARTLERLLGGPQEIWPTYAPLLRHAAKRALLNLEVHTKERQIYSMGMSSLVKDVQRYRIRA